MVQWVILGVHKTDLLRYVLGEEFVEVGCFVETSAKEFTDVDDNAVCILKTESGMIGTLAAAGLMSVKKITRRLFMEKMLFFV